MKPFQGLRIVDLRHQKRGQVRMDLDGAPYGAVANVLARADRADDWAKLFRAAPALHAALAPLMTQMDVQVTKDESCLKNPEASVRIQITVADVVALRAAMALVDAPLSEPTFRDRLAESLAEIRTKVREQKCSFPLAIVKGLVEHDDGRHYFGSTLSFSSYAEDAIVAGWLSRNAEDRLTLTDAGRAIYTQLKLDALPHNGRAYMWDWSVVAEATEVL